MRVVIGWLIMMGVALGASDGLMRYTIPGAKVLIGVDWQKARTSPTGRMVVRQFAQGGKAKFSGGEILEAVDAVVVSMLPAEGGKGTGEPRVLVALEGRMQNIPVKKLMAEGTVVEKYKGADLYLPPKQKNTEMILAVVNEKLALMGDRPTIEQVLGEAEAAVDGEMSRRAAELAQTHEIWAVLAAPPGTFVQSKQPTPFDDLESLDFGVSLQKGLGVTALLGTRSERAALSMATALQIVTAMGTTGKPVKNDPSAMLRHLKIAPEKERVRVTLQVPLVELERNVKEMRAKLLSPGAMGLPGLLAQVPFGIPGLGGSREAAKAEAPPRTMAGLPEVELPKALPAPPQTRTIRIVGLDEGVREVTYKTGGGVR